MGMSADYSSIYDPDTDFDAWYTRAGGEVIALHIQPGDRVLELGCATGLMTTRFVAAGATVVGVDRSSGYLERAHNRNLKNVIWEQADIAKHLALDNATYDHITVCNLLHEVADPGAILHLCRPLLRPGGLIHITLQNPLSLHRLVALHAGMIDDLMTVSNRGEAFGTLRLMSSEQLIWLIEQVGFQQIERRGLMLKPYPNQQMERLPVEVLEGLISAARDLPDHSAMNYVVARA